MAELDADDRNKLSDKHATHIRNAIARFDQVKDVSDSERDAAWHRITASPQRPGSTASR